MTAAHMLTLGRVVLGPLFVVLYLYYQEMGIPLIFLPYLLIFIAAISELSDLFDGMLARRRNQVTELGKLIDPMADSIFRLSVFLSMTQGLIQLPLLLALLLFYRDSIISTLRTVCALRGVALAARFTGKLKAIVQAVVAFFIMILIIPYSLGYMALVTVQNISFYCVTFVVIYTLYSGAEYIYANSTYIKRALKINNG